MMTLPMMSGSTFWRGDASMLGVGGLNLFLTNQADNRPDEIDLWATCGPGASGFLSLVPVLTSAYAGN